MSRISALGERELIRRVGRWVGKSRSVIRGIGDDCAVLPGPSGKHLLFASDMLIQGVHFTDKIDPAAVGWKALAVNVSDAAAMGGIPLYAVVSLGLPPSTPVAFVENLYRGLRRCAARFGVRIVGGDTDRSPKIVIDVAILGEVEKSRVVYRSGARSGDQLFVTGRLGGSLRSGRHLRFVPRVREARLLGARWRIHAMIDLSDGLAVDLDRICEASGVSARIAAADLPRHGGCSLTQALADGEDFELLIAVPRREAKALAAWGKKNLRCGLTRIGEILPRRAGERVQLMAPSGRRLPLPREGFRHF